jgi:hypothetical protein
MTHVQLPDTWHGAPATIALPDAAQAGFVRLLSWSALNRTDGSFSKFAATLVRVSPRTLARLVEVGLVTVTPAGWQIVDPGRYLFTEVKRAQKAAAGKAGNVARWGD